MIIKEESYNTLFYRLPKFWKSSERFYGKNRRRYTAASTLPQNRALPPSIIEYRSLFSEKNRAIPMSSRTAST